MVLVILIVLAINIALSMRVLFAIKDGQIVKHVHFLKWVNILQTIAFAILLISFCLLIYYYGRGAFLISFLIYTPFGVTALISNYCCPLKVENIFFATATHYESA